MGESGEGGRQRAMTPTMPLRKTGCWRTGSQCWRMNIFLYITTVQGALSITLITALYAKCIQVAYIFISIHAHTNHSCHAHTTVGEETGLLCSNQCQHAHVLISTCTCLYCLLYKVIMLHNTSFYLHVLSTSCNALPPIIQMTSLH